MRTLALTASVALAACNGDPATRKPSDPTEPGRASAGSAAASAAAPAAGGALPADQQCVWLNICEKWSGCAHIAKAPQYWTVISAARFAPGELVDVVDVCSGAPSCLAARGVPRGETCTSTTTTFVPEPDYECVWTGTACVSRPLPTGAP